MSVYYIGLATTFHDPALAIVDEHGEVVFAEATERYLQHKRAFNMPPDVRENVRRLLRNHCDPKARFVIAKPWSRKMMRFLDFQAFLGIANHEKFPRRGSQLTKYLMHTPRLLSVLWQQQCSFKHAGGHLADILRNEHGNTDVSYRHYDHHLTHAATACFTSPFQEAVCMIVDGQGEWGSISYYRYHDGALERIGQVKGAESLGVIYGVSTDICGFDSEKGEEWKVMGLAPYGKLNEEVLSIYHDLLEVNGLEIRYRSKQAVRDWHERMQRWQRPLDEPPMAAADLAYTVQFFYADVMNRLLKNLRDLGISDHLVLGGGCALNSSYNGQIVGSKTGFRALHVPSAPSDDGNAIGSALLAWQEDHPEVRRKPKVLSPYLGSDISRGTLKNLLEFGRIPGLRHFPGTIHEETARRLAEGKLVAWMQGRAEFGPRALGNRSILADPRPPEMKEKINALVKFREEFRPFAPSILDEYGCEYFEHYQVTPYMERTLTFTAAAEEKVPAIVHVNRTGRLQSVRREWNERYYDLISAFHRITGVPMLLNTSLNIMGKPIVHSIEDVLGLFYTCGLDVLVIDDYLIEKENPS